MIIESNSPDTDLDGTSDCLLSIKAVRVPLCGIHTSIVRLGLNYYTLFLSSHVNDQVSVIKNLDYSS